MITNFEDLKIEIKQYLPEFLEYHNVKILNNGNRFSCIVKQNHKRGDMNPSAALIPESNNTQWTCFGCKSSGDIFTAAQHLEGMELDGSGFLDTVRELAKRFNIIYDSSVLEQSENYKSVQTIHNYIEKLIKEKKNESLLCNGKYGRTYTPELSRNILDIYPFAELDGEALLCDLKIKFGSDIDGLAYYNSIKDTLDPIIFNKNSLIFPLYTSTGTVYGFGARISEESIKENEELPKYKYTANSGLLLNQNPFLYHLTKDTIKDQKKVTAVEGQFDSLVAYCYGITNVISTYGSNMREQYLKKLKANKVITLNMAYDGDEAGLHGLKRTIELNKDYEFNLTCMDMPDGLDPDTLLIDGDLELFESKNEIPAMEFYLKKFQKNIKLDSEGKIYSDTLKFIVENIRFAAIQDKYVPLISDIFGYNITSIHTDLRKLNNNEDITIKKCNKIIDKLMEAKDSSREVIFSAISDAKEEVGKLSEKEDEDLFSLTRRKYNALITGQIKDARKIYTGFPVFDSSCSILTNNLTVIGGWASNGKSSLMRYFLYNMILDERNENPIVLYFSLDDDATSTLTHFAANATGVGKSYISALCRDNRFLDDQIIKPKRDKFESMLSDSLFIFGKEDVRSIDKIEMLVSRFREKFRDRIIIVMIDAVNDLDEVAYAADERRSIDSTYNRSVSISRDYSCAVIDVSHFTKRSQDADSTGRPSVANLKGSSSIDHAAQTILLLYSESRYCKNDETYFRHDMVVGNEHKSFPIFDLYIAKDKNAKPNMWLPYKYYPTLGEKIEECDQSNIDFLNSKRGTKPASGEIVHETIGHI